MTISNGGTAIASRLIIVIHAWEVVIMLISFLKHECNRQIWS